MSETRRFRSFGKLRHSAAPPPKPVLYFPATPDRRSIKIGVKVVSHGRYVTFQMAEAAISRLMFRNILMLIARLRAPPGPACEVQGSNATNNDGRGAP
jgi:hypothetical protein